MFDLYSPNIQVVIWTWKKFLLFTLDEKVLKMKEEDGLNAYIANRFLANRVNEISGTSNCHYYDFLEIVPTVPLMLNAGLGVNGGGSLSMNFLLDKDISKNFRLMDRPDASNYEKEKRAEFDYRYLISNYFINENKEYYQDSEGKIFSDEMLDGENLEKQAPQFVIQPMQPVWVFAKNEEGYWTKVWTGLITNVKEDDTPGTTRSISVQGVNFLQLTAKIPIIHRRWSNFFFPTLLPEEIQDKVNWMVWLSSSVSPAKGSFDDLSKDVKLLFKEMARQFNRSYGLISLDKAQEDYLVGIVRDNKRFFGEGGITADENLLRSSVHTFFETIEGLRPYRFRIYEEEDPTENRYVGEENYIKEKENGYITIDDLVDVNGNIGKLMWGGQWHVSENVLAFNKLYANTAGFWDLNYTSMHSIYEKLRNTFQVNIYNDCFGNLVMDYPRFNSFPYRTVEQNDDNYKDMEDDKYVLQKYEGNFNYAYDIGRAITMLTQPSSYFYNPNFKDLEKSMLTGYVWGDLDELLTFGLSRKDMPRLFQAMGVKDAETNNIKGFLDKVAEAFKDRFNMNIFSATVSLKAKTHLQIGRNCLIPYKEKVYYILSKNVSWNAGSDLGVNLTLGYGKPLWKELVNPWKEHLDDLKALELPTGKSPKPLTWGVKVNGKNICSVMREALPNMMEIVFGESKSDWKDKVDYLCNNGKFGLKQWSYMRTAFESLLMYSDDAFKSKQNLIIDPRLMYTAAVITKRVYDNRYTDWYGSSPTELAEKGMSLLDAYPVMQLVSCPYYNEKRKKGRSLRIQGVKLTLYDFRPSHTVIDYGGTKSKLKYCERKSILVDLDYHAEDPTIHVPLALPTTNTMLPFIQMKVTVDGEWHYEKMIKYIENFFVSEEGNQFGEVVNRLDPETNKESPLGSYVLDVIAEQEGLAFYKKADEEWVRKKWDDMTEKIVEEEATTESTVPLKIFCEDLSEVVDEGEPLTEQEAEKKKIEGKYGTGPFVLLEPDKNYLIYCDYAYTDATLGNLIKIYNDEILISLGNQWKGK